MTKREKNSIFKGKVKINAQKNRSSNYGYLQLPRGVPVFVPEPGTRVLLDIIPYRVTSSNHIDRDDSLGIAVPGSLWWKRPFKVHRNIGSDNDTVVCPTSIARRCPICEYRAKQIKEGASREITDALKYNQRNLYVVIPKKDKKYEERPHIWDVSHFLFQSLLIEELEEDDEYEVFPDLERGYTLRIRFDSRSIGTGKPFAEASRIDFEERLPYPESILEKVPNLDEVLYIMSSEQLEKKFLEMEDIIEEEEEEEEEIEEPQKTSMPKSIGRRESKEEEEEEEEPKTISRKHFERPTPNHKGKCPHGHKFGVDTEEFNECLECEMWDKCMDEKEGQ